MYQRHGLQDLLMLLKRMIKEAHMEQREYKTSKAKRKANYRYDDKFERINCRFNVGTIDRIKKLGYSSNNFIRLAVAEKLEREEKILGKG